MPSVGESPGGSPFDVCSRALRNIFRERVKTSKGVPIRPQAQRECCLCYERRRTRKHAIAPRIARTCALGTSGFGTRSSSRNIRKSDSSESQKLDYPFAVRGGIIRRTGGRGVVRKIRSPVSRLLRAQKKSSRNRIAQKRVNVLGELSIGTNPLHLCCRPRCGGHP